MLLYPQDEGSRFFRNVDTVYQIAVLPTLKMAAIGYVRVTNQEDSYCLKMVNAGSSAMCWNMPTKQEDRNIDIKIDRCCRQA
jgi:hypothetical protein